MTNYLKRNKKVSGRGMRTGVSGGQYFANVKHLSRILLFLRENPNGFYTKTDISKNCCARGAYIDSAIRFLVREGLVSTKKESPLNYHRIAIKVYSIKDKQKNV